jgi:tetrahydromethanopterin S-methyltransferase subunit G
MRAGRGSALFIGGPVGNDLRTKREEHPHQKEEQRHRLAANRRRMPVLLCFPQVMSVAGKANPMGTIEDLRKVIQDFVAPDLKALATRLDALEKHVDERFAAAEKTANARFDAVYARFDVVDARFDAMSTRLDTLEKRIDERFTAAEKQVDLKFQTLSNQMAANHAALMQALDLDRRMERVEAKLAAGQPAEAKQ